MIAQIVVDSKTGRKVPFFSYLIPEELVKQIQVGQIVQVPFRGRKTFGLVWKLEKESSLEGKKLLTVLSITNHLPIPSYLLELSSWLASYYFSSLSTALFSLLPKPAIRITGVEHNQTAPAEKKNKIYSLNAKKNLRLLAYRDILKLAQKKERTVMVIFPTIAEAEDFYQSLPEKQKVRLIHSKMAKGEKYRIFCQAGKGKFSLITTRAGLAYPLENLSYYIIDSPQALTYTSDMTPRYQTLEVIQKLAEIRGINLLIGSVIPRLKDYLLFKEGRLQQIQSPGFTSPFKALDILIHQAGEKKGLDYSLQTEINRALARGWKTALFVEKFDSNQVLFCPDCGKVFNCPKCNSQLTYKSNCLICQNCHYERESINKCDNCHNLRLIPLGFSKKKMLRSLEELFPQASIKTIEDPDWQSGSLLLTDGRIFQSPDFVTDLVISLETDQMLLSHHYDNDEKVFSRLTELANLARSKMIIQTQHPDNQLIQFFGQKNLTGLLEYLAKQRKEHGLPPFRKIMKIYLSDREEEKALERAEKIYHELTKVAEKKVKLKVYEPMPRAGYKTGGKYWMQILVKFSTEEEQKMIYQVLPDEVSVEIDQ